MGPYSPYAATLQQCTMDSWLHPACSKAGKPSTTLVTTLVARQALATEMLQHMADPVDLLRPLKSTCVVEM